MDEKELIQMQLFKKNAINKRTIMIYDEITSDTANMVAELMTSIKELDDFKKVPKEKRTIIF